MLSISRCRELLGPDCPLTDQEVERLQNQLYLFAEIALDLYRDELAPAAVITP
jgi:hypothetical protein